MQKDSKYIFAGLAILALVAMLGLNWIAKDDPEPGRGPSSHVGGGISPVDQSSQSSPTQEKANSDSRRGSSQAGDYAPLQNESSTEIQSQLVGELARLLVESGELTADVSDLDAEFEAQAIDPNWSAQYEADIQNAFSNETSLADYYVADVDCRETLCRGNVRRIDGAPFDYAALATLGASTSQVDSMDIDAVHISGPDSDFAKVYFARVD